jgi:3-hydroxypropanoate dehydrogenase
MTATFTEPDAGLALSDEAQDLLFREARTASTFTGEPVSDKQIRAVYDLMKFAPTSMNTQPLRIVLVRSPEARKRLVTHMSDRNQPKTAAAPLVAILAADLDFHEHLPRLVPHRPNAKDAFADEAKRAASARFNATLQMGYFILGVRAAGLAAGPMTGFDADGLNAEFFGDGRYTVLAVVNIGKPGEGALHGRAPRLDYDEAVSSV